MKKLPIGVQDFEKMCQDDYLYVDKTKHLYNLIKDGSVYFLSRPRRFGKSLMLSTLESIFLCKRNLFKGLWIDGSDYDWTVYPVIRIDMSKTDRSSAQMLSSSLSELLQEIAKRHEINIKIENVSAGLALNRLIEALVTRYQQKVVVLIDEYDKPMLDAIDDIEKAKGMRDILRDFYTILKAQDGNLKFLMLTGITKFSKVSIFSGLNNLQDITMDDEFAAILGYTQRELETVFAPWIEQLAEHNQHSLDEERAKIKHWYNGYQFSPYGVSVYNPFSTLLLFKQKQYRPHWFATGTPTFLIKLLEKADYSPEMLNHLEVGDSSFESYDIDRMDMLALFYQTGYLTIDRYDPEFRSYKLGFPNFEVQQSFNAAVLSHWAEVNDSFQDNMIMLLVRAVQANDMERFFNALKSFLASIPYELHQATEAYYHTIFYLIFHLFGYRIGAEVHTNIGRIDAVIELKDRILIFEFKLDQSADVALQQIHDKKYADKYRVLGKPIHLFGVSFSTIERNVVEWKTEKL